ncbi:hypothetical protein PI124_g16827 [Phytophthora idaei]|nr:hypothetical protein PI124_g16827 [Phytophthora idaei]
MASESAPPNHSELPAESLDIENDDENDQVDPQLLSQRLGYLLQTVIMSKDVSPSCLAALGRMADHREILDAAFVQEIKRTGALLNSVKCDWGDCQVMSLNLIELLNYIEEHHIATDMSRFLNGVRSIYDVVSINVVQVVQNAAISRGLMIDLAMWLLIAAVGAVYLSCIWFACSGRHLHRHDEEIRQGHEADTWAELATTQKKRVAMFTTAHIVNFFVMLVILLLGMPAARLWIKNFLGWITFSDTCRGIDNGPAKNVLPLWDLEREVKHRVWHGIWRALMLELSWHLAFTASVITGKGKRTHTTRQTLRSALEGVGVYWDDATGTRDGHLDSKTCFGKMYVVPYPFHCVVVYDDCKDETIIRDDKDGKLKLAKLLFLNFTPQIMAKRDLRHKLRVFSDRDTSINFPFSRPEQVTVTDGVIVITDAYGNTQTTPRFSTVTFTCYYTNGVIGVSSKGDAKGRIMAEGFNVTMTYRDGHGKAVAPYTGMVSELRKIFTQTQEVWEAGIPELRQQHQEYRRTLQDKHAQANATLTDAFWYFVYNNANLSRENLEEHFKRRELNPRLKLLAATHQVALDSLYLHLFSHTFWHIFWDDVYVRNAEMRRLRMFKQDLDPRQPTTICYHVMQRPELEAWLHKRQLLGSKRLFHPRLLDLLYQEMGKRFESKRIRF